MSQLQRPLSLLETPMPPEEELHEYARRIRSAEDRETGLQTLLQLAREGSISELLDKAERCELIALGELELVEARRRGE